MRKCGIIDMGSNTVRLCVYNIEGKDTKLLLSRKVMAGLASYVKKGNLTNEGIEIACDTLALFQQVLKNLDIDEYFAFATASLRNIDNASEVIHILEQRTGILVDLVSGEDEGRLSLKGALSSTDLKDGLLIDLGGGSTEFVPFKNHEPISSMSLRAGSLTLHKKFVGRIFPTKSERHAIMDYYEEALVDERIKIPDSDVICGVGGSVRAIKKVLDYAHEHNAKSSFFTYDDVVKLYRRLKNSDREAIDLMLHATPDRLHTLIPGIIAVRIIMEKAHCTKIVVSQTGVREGYLYTKILGQ